MAILPLEGAAYLVFSYASFKEVFLFSEVDGFTHPWEWIVAVVYGFETNAF